MPRISRRQLTYLAATGAAGVALGGTVRAQPQDVPGEFQHVPMLPGLAGPYPDLAGVDPAAPLPARWVPATVAPALAPLPGHIAAWERQTVLYRPAKAGFNLHAYGYENRRLGLVQHIPVCDTLAQLTGYFTGGQNAGLTTYGIGRTHFTTLDLTAPDGAVWRVPFAETHRYGPVSGAWSPWAQGVVNRSGACAVQPHPVAAYLGSGVPNGAYDSVENVARTGLQGMTPEQLNSNAMLRAACAVRWGYAIDDGTQVSHAQIDRVNRCSDPGWPTSIEDEARAIAGAIIAGDLSRLRGAVQLSAPPQALDPQAEAFGALVWSRENVDKLAIRAALRDEANDRREQALNGFAITDTQVARSVWADEALRARWDEVEAGQRRTDAEAQLRRLGG